LAVGDPRLAPTDDLAVARALLERYAPRDAAQAAERARLLAFLDAHPADAHRRELAPGHLTASALVVDADGERALLTLHRKLSRWLQLGGHCDGDANLAGVALRECLEESDIAGLTIDPLPIDLDVHTIPARPGEPEHSHLDTRFVVYAPPGARERLSHESRELAWFSPAELVAIDVDDSVRRLFERVFAR
ncbi:MAG TPA: NUDIX hydrolase, partial [Planctomycetota bacterium]|nr:NUDIX hydrolase [Planctomycetota bacterium]